jgi:GNAT superfamily N-acetyltransferase
MAQCNGRNQRTGERCKRTASGDAATCYYHSPAAAKAKTTARRIGESGPVGPAAFTTKGLSKSTFGDFETLFAEGTGWGRCGCLFALDAPRSTRGGTWAEQRAVNVGTMRVLVEQGRSRGVLVYDAGAPVGWCQFVPNDVLRLTNVSASGAAWYVTCFVIDPRYRGLGATGVALRGALEEIARKGGGVVEGHATAMVPGAPPRAERKGTYIENDVLFSGGSAKARFGLELEGVGTVTALYRSTRSMHGAPLGGTVDLYRREGFQAVAVLPRRPKGQLADRIIMRRYV